MCVGVYLLLMVVAFSSCEPTGLVDLRDDCPQREVKLPFLLIVNLGNRSTINCTIKFAQPVENSCNNSYDVLMNYSRTFHDSPAKPCWELKLNVYGDKAMELIHESKCDLYRPPPFNASYKGSGIRVSVYPHLSKEALNKVLSEFSFYRVCSTPNRAIGPVQWAGICVAVILGIVAALVVFVILYKKKCSNKESPQKSGEDGIEEMPLLTGFKAGDMVRVNEDDDLVRGLQLQSGGWHDDMRTVLGQKGRVLGLVDNGDVCVRFSLRQWVFHPDCLIPIAGYGQGAGGIDIFEAVRFGRQSEVQQWLDSLLEPPDEQCSLSQLNQTEAGNQTLLHCASRHGHEEIVTLLLIHGASVTAKDDCGDTPLHLAARNDKAVAARALLDFRNGKAADVNDKNSRGKTPLHLAAAANHINVLTVLLDQDVINICEQDEDGNTPLHAAVVNNHKEAVTALIGAGDDIRTRNKDGFTAFLLAAQLNRKELMQEMFSSQRGAVQLCRDKKPSDEFTALHLAAYNGHAQVCQLLLSVGGASADVTNALQQTPLHLAYLHQSAEVVPLINAIQNFRDRQDAYGCTPAGIELSYHPAMHNMIGVIGKLENTQLYETVMAAVSKAAMEISPRNRECSVPQSISAFAFEMSENFNKHQGMLPRNDDVDQDNFLNLLMRDLDREFSQHKRQFRAPPAMAPPTAPANRPAGVFFLNDRVRLIKDRMLVETLLLENDLWNNNMAVLLNPERDFVGCVASVSDKQLLVDMGNNQFILHPSCLELIEQSPGSEGVVVDHDYVPLLLRKFRDNLSMMAVNRAEFVLEVAQLRGVELVKSDFVQSTDIDWNLSDEQSRTLLHYACFRGHAVVVQELLKLGAKPSPRDNSEDTPLHLAAFKGKLEAAYVLLEAKVDPRVRNKHNFTPLHMAAAGNFPDVAELLVKNGADCYSGAVSRMTPLHYAALKNNVAAVDFLATCSDYQAVDDFYCTAFHLAAKLGHTEVLASMLANCPHPDRLCQIKKRPDGYTALHLSAVTGCVSSSLYLVKSGRADVNAVNDMGQTPLHLAVSRQCCATVDLLVRAGAKVNVQDREEDTPLHNAMRHQSTGLSSVAGEIVKFLINHGADCELINRVDKSPLALCRNEKFRDEVLAIIPDQTVVLDVAAQMASVSSPKPTLWSSRHTDMGTATSMPLLQHPRAGADSGVPCGPVVVHNDQQSSIRSGPKKSKPNLPISSKARAAVTKSRGKPSSVVKVGDWVQIVNDAEMVENLQKPYGEWNDEIRQSLGKIGLVINVSPDEVTVEVDERTLSFHANCLKLTNSTADRKSTPLFSGLPASASANGFIDAASLGDCETVRQNLNARINVDSVNEQKQTALHLASANGHLPVVELLVKYHADLDLLDACGDSPLHLAVMENQPTVVSYLLVRQAYINCPNRTDSTPLHLAAMKGFKDIAQELIKNGSDVLAKDFSGNTPLHEAALIDCALIARMILVAGDTMTDMNKEGFTAFHVAAKLGNVQTLRTMLEQCKRSRSELCSDKKPDGFTALHLAVTNGHLEASKLLIGESDPNCVNETGQTPLHLAVIGEFPELVQLLIDNGANVNHQDNDGNTPLHDAVRGHRLNGSETLAEIAVRLVERGADVRLDNNEKERPIDLCSDEELRKRLRQLSADYQVTAKDV